MSGKANDKPGIVRKLSANFHVMLIFPFSSYFFCDRISSDELISELFRNIGAETCTVKVTGLEFLC